MSSSAVLSGGQIMVTCDKCSSTGQSPSTVVSGGRKDPATWRVAKCPWCAAAIDAPVTEAAAVPAG